MRLARLEVDNFIPDTVANDRVDASADQRPARCVVERALDLHGLCDAAAIAMGTQRTEACGSPLGKHDWWHAGLWPERPGERLFDPVMSDRLTDDVSLVHLPKHAMDRHAELEEWVARC